MEAESGVRALSLETAETPRIREENRVLAARHAFLEHFAATGRVVESARKAGIARASVYRWIDADPAFAEAFKEAHFAFVESLEAEADRRGKEGVEKPTGWYRGVAGGTVREFSDQLLLARLKAEAPEKYADRSESKASIASIDVTKLSDEQLERIVRGENPLAVLSSPKAVRHLPAQDADVMEAELVETDAWKSMKAGIQRLFQGSESENNGA